MSGTCTIYGNNLVQFESDDVEMDDEIKIDGNWYAISDAGRTYADAYYLDGSIHGDIATGDMAYSVAKRSNRFINLRFDVPDSLVGLYNTVFTDGISGGTWINCVGPERCYRVSKGGDDHPKMINCIALEKSFTGDQVDSQASGTWINCKGGEGSFAACSDWGSPITIEAVFIGCTATGRSYGLGKKCEGTFINCIGGDGSFGGYNSGSYYGEFAGVAVNCIAGDNSFGAGASGCKLTGSIQNCRITGLDGPIYSEGGVIDGCVITVTGGTNQNAIVLEDSNSQIYNSRIFVDSSGTGTPIVNDGTARSVVLANCVMNNSDNDADAMGASVTNNGGNNQVVGNID